VVSFLPPSSNGFGFARANEYVLFTTPRFEIQFPPSPKNPDNPLKLALSCRISVPPVMWATLSLLALRDQTFLVHLPRSLRVSLPSAPFLSIKPRHARPPCFRLGESLKSRPSKGLLIARWFFTLRAYGSPQIAFHASF